MTLQELLIPATSLRSYKEPDEAMRAAQAAKATALIAANRASAAALLHAAIAKINANEATSKPVEKTIWI